MPEESVETFLTMYRYKRGIELLYETPEELPRHPQPPVHQIRAMIRGIYESGRTILSETESKQILAHYGIETTMPRPATTREEAAAIAADIGFPVAIKVQSEDITHKSDAGCVMLNIEDAEGVVGAFDQIIDNALSYKPDARIDGVAVQRMLTGKHHELILGAKRDPIFGATVLFGAGGVATEAFGDTSIGFPPLNQTLARRLMEETRIYRLLREGHRNTPPADISLVERTLLSFSQLLIDIPEIHEADLNPVLVSARRCVAADARMIIDDEWIGRDATKHEHLALSPYPNEFIKEVAVDGKRVTLRPIRPEDEGRWLDMFNSFSPETKRFRFFHVIGKMPHNERVRYVFSDYAREIAIVPVLREDGDEKILGVGRITGVPGDGTAEFAIALRDDWQSRGLGERVFDHLLDISRHKGWHRLVAQVLPDNHKMINLFRKKGCTFDYHSEDGMYSVSYDIQPSRHEAHEQTAKEVAVERAIWQGASGQRYRFEVYPLDQGIEQAEPGIYIFARRSGEGWEAIYIGQGELKVDVAYKTLDRCIGEKHATHVHLHVDGSEEQRRAACADLLAAHIEAYEPHGCNVRF
jgi:acetyltransferase